MTAYSWGLQIVRTPKTEHHGRDITTPYFLHAHTVEAEQLGKVTARKNK